MISKIIDIGAKVDIGIVSQLERSFRMEDDMKFYKSQVYDILENEELELLMPTERGKLQLLSLGLRYEFVFYTKLGLYKAVGHIKERYKTDNRYMIRVELNTPLSKFQRRQFFRLRCVIDMNYFLISREQAETTEAKEIMEELRGNDFYEKQKAARIVDISGGGVRFVSDEKNEDDTYVLMTVLLFTEDGDKQYTIVGHIIDCERIEGVEMKFVNRVEFMLKDSKLQEEIIKYIFAEERKARKNDKG